MRMKKNKMAVRLLVVLEIVLWFTGCQKKTNAGISEFYYANSENYIGGETELSETVENIEIDWLAGDVTIETHDSNVVSFSEESIEELNNDTQIHYWLDGTTLRIKFCQSGQVLNGLEKDLSVLIPKDLMLTNLKVNSISADICLETIQTESAYISTTSGNIQIGTSAITRFDAGTISGKVSLSVQTAPEMLDISTTSGNIDLSLPENASFTLDYDSTSGELSSELSCKKYEGKYVFGDGKGEYSISTVSGDVSIMTAK